MSSAIGAGGKVPCAMPWRNASPVIAAASGLPSAMARAVGRLEACRPSPASGSEDGRSPAASAAAARSPAGARRPGARTAAGGGGGADGRARARPRSRARRGGARIRRQLRLTTSLAVQLPQSVRCALIARPRGTRPWRGPKRSIDAFACARASRRSQPVSTRSTSLSCSAAGSRPGSSTRMSPSCRTSGRARSLCTTCRRCQPPRNGILAPSTSRLEPAWAASLRRIASSLVSIQRWLPATKAAISASRIPSGATTSTPAGRTVMRSRLARPLRRI